jgi:hypothetical protein
MENVKFLISEFTALLLASREVLNFIKLVGQQEKRLFETEYTARKCVFITYTALADVFHFL